MVNMRQNIKNRILRLANVFEKLAESDINPKKIFEDSIDNLYKSIDAIDKIHSLAYHIKDKKLADIAEKARKELHILLEETAKRIPFVD